MKIAKEIQVNLPISVVPESERINKKIMKKNERGLLSCYATVLLQEI